MDPWTWLAIAALAIAALIGAALLLTRWATQRLQTIMREALERPLFDLGRDYQTIDEEYRHLIATSHD